MNCSFTGGTNKLPWRITVPAGKQTLFQLVNKILSLYGTRHNMSVFTTHSH